MWEPYVSQRYGPPRLVTGIALLLYLLNLISIVSFHFVLFRFMCFGQCGVLKLIKNMPLHWGNGSVVVKGGRGFETR
jgi:hypothetical protein